MNTRSTLIAATTLSALIITGLTGCATEGGGTASADCEDTYTIGFSQPTGEAAYVKALKAQVEVAAKENPCVELLLDNTQQNNLESQRATLESWVTRQVDAIVLLPVDANALEGLRKQQQSQGGTWLTYGGPQEGTNGSVGFDSVESGKLVGNDAVAWYQENYPDGGATAALTTLTTLPSLAGRWEGPEQILGEAGIDIVSTQDCADSTCGLQIAENALRQHPDIRMFIGFNDDAALGALRAVQNAGIDPETVYIAGQDGTKEGLEAVKAGAPYRASAAISLTDLATGIIDTAIESVNAEGEPVDAVIPTVLATADDPAALEKLLSAFGG